MLLTDVIIEEKGYVDKYMGDAIMAFWNVLLDDAEHQVKRLRGRDPDAREARRGQQ